ncbi:MAG: cobalamin biosynthesis protein [Paenibacillaceae bacterium]|jgi:G3E family GTPase|nr:cobalamin biosynthesis protein [Paenibacillaceae bacterium]
MDHPVPVFILSGFLGSGKTTLLSRVIRHAQERGRKPAVVMNELGEVNLDGIAVGIEVPMAEMLDGCICCTVRGDLGITIQQLVKDEQPDIIFIEATGVANPMEILDGVTEASLYMKVEMKGVITVADAVLLREQSAKGAGKTYRLLEEQIRCASVIILNKADLASPDELDGLEQTLGKWNAHAQIIRSVRADVDLGIFDALEGITRSGAGQGQACSCQDGHRHEAGHEHGEECGCHDHEHDHDHRHEHQHDHNHDRECDHDHDHNHDHQCGHEHDHHHARGHHHTHDHVMVYTRYLSGPVDSGSFEELVGRLPENVYRAKGVLTFSDTANRYLFQYAYRQADFMKITPQINVPDVVVFIGEQIPKALLEEQLEQLEQPGRERQAELGGQRDAAGTDGGQAAASTGQASE